MENEIWKDIPGYEGKYQVGNMGHVRSLLGSHLIPRVLLLKTAKDKKGYLRCALSLDGRLSTYKVHRLVASAFVPNPNNRPQVNHKNGDKKDNSAGNLEWVTNLENQRHAQENLLQRNKMIVVFDKRLRKELLFPSIKAAALFMGLRSSKAMLRRLTRELKFYRKAENYSIRFATESDIYNLTLQ